MRSHRISSRSLLRTGWMGRCIVLQQCAALKKSREERSAILTRVAGGLGSEARGALLFEVTHCGLIVGTMTDSEEWLTHTTAQGMAYYYNSKTGETSWDYPTDTAPRHPSSMYESSLAENVVCKRFQTNPGRYIVCLEVYPSRVYLVRHAIYPFTPQQRVCAWMPGNTIMSRADFLPSSHACFPGRSTICTKFLVYVLI